MALIQELVNYKIFPVSEYAEKIPSMTEHKKHQAAMKGLGLEGFDSGLEYEKIERQRLEGLIKLNYKLHGDVPGIAILKSEIAGE